MDCWETLELEAGSDERSIKRQYARLLKSSRPDETPEAFQLLREAYETALNWARWSADNDQPEPPVQQVQAATLELPELNPSALFEREVMAPVSSVNVANLLQQWLSDLRPSTLSAQHLKAEEAGLAVEFERSVLEQCLTEEPATELRNAACHQYGWLEPSTPQRLSEMERLPLYQWLINEQLRNLQERHDQGAAQDLHDGMQALFEQPWLQSYDSRALLESSVVTMLLEMPTWRAATLDSIASIFSWREAKQEPNCPRYQWQALLDRGDAERYYAGLIDDAQSRKPSVASRASRLIVAPFEDFQRRRFSRDFSEEEIELSGEIASKLINRYPQLLERLPGAPLDERFWRDLQPTVPVMSRTLWLWLLLFLLSISHTILGFNRVGGTSLPSMVMSCGIAAFVLNRILLVYDIFSHRLNRFDYWLSEFLPRRFNQYGAGLRPLRHGALALVAGVLLARIGGIYGDAMWLASIPPAIIVLILINLTLRSGWLPRHTEATMGFLRQHSELIKKWLIGIGVVLALAAAQYYSANH